MPTEGEKTEALKVYQVAVDQAYEKYYSLTEPLRIQYLTISEREKIIRQKAVDDAYEIYRQTCSSKGEKS